MVSAVLATKLYIPTPPAQYVARQRLIAMLNGVLRAKLTLVAAPAGFGKTSLVADWLHAQPLRTVWFSLDERDSDLSCFLTYLVAALQQISPHIGETIQHALKEPGLPPLEELMTALVNDLATAEVPFILVLDDYHFIDDPVIHEAIQFLVDYQPPSLHLIFLTRREPPLALSRLRVRQQMVELRASDLQFTRDEAEQFLNDEMRLNLDAQTIAALEQRTEGWIAGLQLAALSMRDQPDRAGFVRGFTGSNRLIMDYLLDEVFKRLTPDAQADLLRLSVLDRFTASLLDAVLENQIAGDLLGELEQNNLFLIPLDDKREWYRFHHLFRDLLYVRLQQTDSGAIPALHRRASRWFDAQGYMDEAVDHALLSGEIGETVELIERYSRPLMLRSEVPLLRRWLSQLGNGVVRSRARLALVQVGINLLSGDLSAAKEWLEAAERARATAGNESEAERKELNDEVTINRTMLDSITNLPDVLPSLQHAFEGLGEGQSYLQALIQYRIGQAYHVKGSVQQAIAAYTRSVAIGAGSGNLLIASLATVELGGIHDVHGRLHLAEQAYRRALEIATDTGGKPFPVAGFAYVGLGKVLREWNRLEEALETLERGLALGDTAENDSIRIDGLFTLALTLGGQGRWHAAHVALDRAAPYLVKYEGFPVQQRAATFRARLWLSEGKTDLVSRAIQWADASALRSDGEITDDREIDYLMLARAWIAQRTERTLGNALALLDRLYQHASARERLTRVIETLALRALGLAAKGDEASVFDALSQALRLAEPEGYVRIFADLGAGLLALLKRLSARQRSPYVRTLIETFPSNDPETVGPDAMIKDLPEPLTAREVEVLRLIAAGLSNKEIGDQLYLTEGTIKGYTSIIYGKMGVRRRTEAVERARDLGLI